MEVATGCLCYRTFNGSNLLCAGKARSLPTERRPVRAIQIIDLGRRHCFKINLMKCELVENGQTYLKNEKK